MSQRQHRTRDANVSPVSKVQEFNDVAGGYRFRTVRYWETMRVLGNGRERSSVYLLMLGRHFASAALALCCTLRAVAQESPESIDYRALIRQGETALARNELSSAARAFQRASAITPS